jgi:hypothetical protein
MLIKVTQKHIDAGIPKNACFCPIAAAVRELGFNEIALDDSVAVIKKKEGHWDTVSVPSSVKKFIAKFDSGKFVEPFEFELDI